jgi:GT2 family glycosyltransferase
MFAVPRTATVIVPTHSGADRIGALLDSLAAQTVSHQLLVVDNASSDGTGDVLARYPDVEAIRLERNLGFGRAVNLAARRADGTALVLVNDDCVCDPGFVEEIIRPLGDRSVMSAGVLRDQADEMLIDTAGMELDPTLNVFDYLHGQPLASLASAPDPIGPSAAAAAFDRDAFLEEGGFDEALFAYWEDVDLVLRLRLQGADCALAREARGTHAHSATLGSGSAEKNRLMGFGRGYLLRKWSVVGGARALRVLAGDGVICAGQALFDRNLAGLAGRLRGARAASRSFQYPGDLLKAYRSPAMRDDLRRRFQRRRRLNRLREEPPRVGLERQLAATSTWRAPANGAFAAELSTETANPIRVGKGNVAFLGGRMTSGQAAVGAELLVDGRPTREAVTIVNPDGGDCAFWWTTLQLPAANGRARIAVSLRARDGAGAGGDAADVATLVADPAARVPVEVDEARLSAAIEAADGEPLVAICMATYDPPEDLFAEQVASIKVQSHGGWICLISDDGSSPERLATIRSVISADPRFVLLEHGPRLGFYGNYERVLAAVPPEAQLVALADQDDRWYPDKLEKLIAGLGDRDLVYGDMRIVGDDGSLISDTYWNRRRNNYTDLASLLVGNTVTGAVSLFRADLLERALPFPPRRSDSYHDHWIALTAMTRRGLAYVDRPLQDYVQHGEATQGHAEANSGASYLQLRMIAVLAWQGLWTLLGRHGAKGWAARYFGMYVRTVIWARVLLMRSPHSLGRRQRRILEWIANADRSPAAVLWLAGRSLRPLWGANEAFGRELLILSSVLWAGALRLRTRLRGLRARPAAMLDDPP